VSTLDAALFWRPYPELENLQMLPDECSQCGHEFHEGPCREEVSTAPGWGLSPYRACPCSVGRPMTDLYGRPEHD
jgi:hypothetical protein